MHWRFWETLKTASSFSFHIVADSQWHVPSHAINKLADSQWHVPACAIKELADSQWHVPARAIKELADSQWHVPARLAIKELADSVRRLNKTNREPGRCDSGPWRMIRWRGRAMPLGVGWCSGSSCVFVCLFVRVLGRKATYVLFMVHADTDDTLIF